MKDGREERDRRTETQRATSAWWHPSPQPFLSCAVCGIHSVQNYGKSEKGLDGGPHLHPSCLTNPVLLQPHSLNSLSHPPAGH